MVRQIRIAIVMHFCLWRLPVMLFCTIFSAIPGFSLAQAAGLNQDATIYILAECEDPDTGALSEQKGTGFVIHDAGYILTAFHVVSCIDSKTKKASHRKALSIRFGSPFEEPRLAQLLRADDQVDVALLKTLGLPRRLPTLSLCAYRNPRPGTTFVAAGFPEGDGYQPVDGRIGNSDVEGGRWSAASPFVQGMSGGPVVINDRVVGMIKGGAANVIARRTITPLYKAKGLIESETGLHIPDCDSNEMTNGRSISRIAALLIAIATFVIFSLLVYISIRRFRTKRSVDSFIKRHREQLLRLSTFTTLGSSLAILIDNPSLLVNFSVEDRNAPTMPGGIDDIEAHTAQHQHTSCAIIGHRGYGKSTLARLLAVRLIERYLSRKLARIPIYVNLSHYLNIDDMGSIEWLKREFPALNRASLRSAEEHEAFLFIVDGLDEYMSSVNDIVLSKLFRSFIFNNSYVVVCRTSHFFRALTLAEGLPVQRIFEVAPWSETIARTYLAALMTFNQGGITTRARWLAPLPGQDSGRPDSSMIPLNTAIAGELLLAGGIVKDDYSKNVAQLFSRYVDVVLNRESSRSGSVLRASQKKAIYQRAIFDVFTSRTDDDTSRISLTSDMLLRSVVKTVGHLPAVGEQRLLDDLTEGGLLNKGEREATDATTYQFMHAAIAEYFLAQSVMAALRNDEEAVRAIFSRLVPQEVYEFLKSMISSAERADLVPLAERGIAIMQAILEEGVSAQSVGSRELIVEQVGHFLAHFEIPSVQMSLIGHANLTGNQFIKRGIAIGLAFGGNSNLLYEYIAELRDELEGAPPYLKNAENLSHQLPYFGDRFDPASARLRKFSAAEVNNTLRKLVAQVCSPLHEEARPIDYFSLTYILDGLNDHDFEEFVTSKIGGQLRDQLLQSSSRRGEPLPAMQEIQLVLSQRRQS